jgi:hypothetical protein
VDAVLFATNVYNAKKLGCGSMMTEFGAVDDQSKGVDSLNLMTALVSESNKALNRTGRLEFYKLDLLVVLKLFLTILGNSSSLKIFVHKVQGSLSIQRMGL